MKKSLEFLKQLAQNNHKDWFTAHKDDFEAAKTELETLTTAIISSVGKWDKEVAGLQAKDCVYRIYRDVRFSKDKTPYKNHLGALIGAGGRKATGAINYLHIEPGKSFAAAGCYLPPPPQLKALRQEIDFNLDEFEAILIQKEFKKHFGGLSIEGGWVMKTAPKGYTTDNPAIEYLKYKSFIVTKYFTDDEVANQSFATEVEKSFKLAKPLNLFINKAFANE